MKRSLLFTLCLLILLAAPIHAQEPTPAAPWPPDPALIFADGVTWEEVQPASPAAQSTPRVIDDFERDMIRVRDEAADTWREFPYPPGVDHIAGAWLHIDSAGRVWVQTEMTNDPLPSQVFVLDPATGEYSPPPTVCDGRVIQAEPGEGQWVAAYAPGTSDHATLCHSATGEQRDILPADVEDWNIGVSPDGDWLVLVGGSFETHLFYLYASPLAGGDLTLLGTDQYSGSTYFSFCGWVSVEKGVLCHSDRYYSRTAVVYLSFDITQPDSLEFLFFGWKNVFFDEDNAQFVSLHSDDYFTHWSGSAGAGRPCTLSIFNANGLHQFELDNECRPMRESAAPFDPDRQVFYRQGNMLYFLTVHSKDAAFADLRGYNLDLDPSDPSQLTVLYGGEIEAFGGVSPDQRYIALITDTNGTYDPYPFSFDKSGGWQITILDSAWDNFELPMRYQSEPLNPGHILWVDEHTLYVNSGTLRIIRTIGGDNPGYYYAFMPGSMRRITLTDEAGADVHIIVDPDLAYEENTTISPDNQYWRFYWSIINLRTLERAQYLRDGVPAGYDIGARWIDNITPQVSIRQGDSQITYRLDLSAIWTPIQAK